MKRVIQVKFRSSRYALVKEKVFTVSDEEWDPVVVGWIWPAVERYAKQTLLSPPNLTQWDALRHAIPGLVNVPCWMRFTEIPHSEIEFEDLRDLFIDIDDAFHRHWGADRGALRSSAIRKFISDYLLVIRPDGALLRANGSFSPKGRGNRQPRSLISDQIIFENGVAVKPPVGAMPHSNPAELKAKVRQRLKEDLDLISSACSAEIDSYFRSCQTIDSILNTTVDEKSERKALEKMCDYKASADEKVDRLNIQERASLIAHYLRQDHALLPGSSAPTYEGSNALGPVLSEWIGIECDKFIRCLRYRYYPHQIVLVAAAVQIQIDTGWNIGSVMELKANRIRELDGGNRYLLQSIKAKTGDDTPFVLIEGRDSAGAKAVRLLLERLIDLKNRGWAKDDEMNLWLSPRSIKEESQGVPISNLAKGLVKLREKYSLPVFTFEQVRVQKLNVISLEKGPIAAAEIAGHSSYSVISGYLDHMAIRRINSSVNLEFQKRWEAEVAARIEVNLQKHPLTPIGDGTSCIDPMTPPDDAWMDAGICNASRCHSGEGCPNRVLQIDRARVLEVLLMRRYYEVNWQRLYASNPESFAEIHMPRLEFNLYLFEYLKKGPYRHHFYD